MGASGRLPKKQPWLRTTQALSLHRRNGAKHGAEQGVEFCGEDMSSAALGIPAGWIDRTNMEWMRKAAMASQRQQQLLGGRGVLLHTATLHKADKWKSRSSVILLIQGSPAEARAAPLFQSTKSVDVAPKRKDALSTSVQDAWTCTALPRDVVLQEIHLHLRQAGNRAVR